ncbi:MAG: hypothetical protein ACAH59_06165 [Pseudobdellovibrionaceae bacterium]
MIAPGYTTTSRARILFLILFLFTPLLLQAQENPNTEKTAEEEYPSSSETWGRLEPGGGGWLLGKNPMGEIRLSAYVLARYLNQMPDGQTFQDHLGREQVVDARHDFQIHRIMMFFKGWFFDPKFRYQILYWTVNSTTQVAIVGSFTYDFSKYFILGVGTTGLPGVRTLNNQHPYFLGNDRQMADEFFKPSFTTGVWASGDITDNSKYRVMVGDNLSQIGIDAKQNDREMAYGATAWWMPSTGEFGPRGGYGDYEDHQQLATRFGFSSAHSREDRYSALTDRVPENTQLKLSDSLNLFEADALAPGVTVQKATYDILALDGGMKYKGFFFNSEFFFRELSHFETVGGDVPISVIRDQGMSLQTSYMLKPKKTELIAAHSYIRGEFNNSWEWMLGANHYPFDTRDFKLNAMIFDVHHSPVNSLFGYYVGGQTGTTIALSADLFF